MLMVCVPRWRNSINASCIFCFVNRSARFRLERSNPIFDISSFWYDCQVAWMWKTTFFLLVLEPLLMISNNEFESVNKYILIARLSACSTCDRSANEWSTKSAKAITSANKTERVTLSRLVALEREVYRRGVPIHEKGYPSQLRWQVVVVCKCRIRVSN